MTAPEKPLSHYVIGRDGAVRLTSHGRRAGLPAVPDEKPQTWRCHWPSCPTAGQWQTVVDVTAEVAWEDHYRREHGARVVKLP